MNYSKHLPELIKALKINPNLTHQMAKEAIGISKAQFYTLLPRAKKDIQTKLDRFREAQDKQIKVDEKAIIDAKKRAKEENLNIIIIPKANWQPFEEFVGYRGYKDANGKIILDHSYTMKYEDFPNPMYTDAVKATVSPTITIETKNYNYPYYPGEAEPKPIDEDTGDEVGILWYQVEGFEIIETQDNILILWPRGHGKTWLLAWYIEWNMKHSKYKCMYLSITDVFNDVADWIYDWADAQGLIPAGSKAKGSQAQRRQTPKSFSLTNGSKFKVWSVLDKKIRGKHGYHVFMDDIIEENSETHPSEQKKIERKWNATLSKMRRGKLIIVNTRIYEGDFIEYLMKQFAKKSRIMSTKNPKNLKRWTLYIDIRTPFVYAKLGEEHDEKGFLLINGKRLLIAPELYTLEFFEAEAAADYRSYMAEYMQEPTSMEGGMLVPKDIQYRMRPHFGKDVQMVGIGIDLSWADNETADMCAIVSCVSHGEWFADINEKGDKTGPEKLYPRFTFIRADVGVFPMFNELDPYGAERKGIFEFILEHFLYLRLNYPNIPLIIAIERNSGGLIIIKIAQREARKKSQRKMFEWLRYCITDKQVAIKWSKDGNTNVKIGITHKKEKVVRVFGELQHSVKEHKEHKGHETQFEWVLENSLFMAQLLAFPKGKYDDGPDAGGMIKDELNRRWHDVVVKRNVADAIVKREERMKKQLEEERYPWLKIQRRANRHKAKVKRKMARYGFNVEDLE